MYSVWGQGGDSCQPSPPLSSFFSSSSSVVLVGTGFEVKDHTAKPETPNSLPAPPQMPLPEIPQPWLVSSSPAITRIARCLCYFWFQGQVIKAQFWKKGGHVLPKALL